MIDWMDAKDIAEHYPVTEEAAARVLAHASTCSNRITQRWLMHVGIIGLSWGIDINTMLQVLSDLMETYENESQ